MAIDEHDAGPGELMVRLLSCVERATDRVEHVLPSVDHQALRRAATAPAAVRFALRRYGPEALVEPFEAWLQLLRDFDSSVMALTDIGEVDSGSGPEYQARLNAAIAEARRCRQAVEEAAEDLRRRVATQIDTALAHESVSGTADL